MSQDNKFVKWLFQQFISEQADIDFSQLLDFEEDVQERLHRIAQIPEERRVNVLDTVILDDVCKFVVDEDQEYIDDFDLSYLTESNTPTQNTNTVPKLGHAQDVKPIPNQQTTPNDAVPGHSRNPYYMNGQNGNGGIRPVASTTNATGVIQPAQVTRCTVCPEDYHPEQNGYGMIRKEKKPLFTVVRGSQRTFKKFNMQGVYYLLDVPPPVPGANAEHWLRIVLNSVITYFKNCSDKTVKPGDYIGFQLANPCFIEKPVYVGLRRADQLDGDIILDKIVSILNSNQDFFINGRFEVEFNHIQMPHGSGRAIRKQFGQTDEEFIQGKASFIKYQNPRNRFPDDEYCLPYAILLGRAFLDKDTKTFDSYRRSIIKLRGAAENLCAAAQVNISMGGCSIEEVQKFQAILPDYQIVIYRSLEALHKPYTDLDYYQPDRKINILLQNEHYTAMRTLQACMASQYICPDCHARTSSRLAHKKCLYTCPCCLNRPPCPVIPNNEMIECPDCLRKFRGSECFVNHINVKKHEHYSVCQRIKTCPDCGVGYYEDANRPHDCDSYFCVTCETTRPNEHQCYMSLYKTKRCEEDNVLYIQYDFETMQNTLLDPTQPNKYKHVPNLCVVQSYCHTCQGEPDRTVPCVDCGERLRVFHSTDCVEDLLKYIILRGNERKPNEEVEQDGPVCKKRKRQSTKKFKKIVAIAHNMGGVDGQFILNYILKSGRFPNPTMIMNGSRLINMNLGFNVTFLDSLNYFHKALASLPEMFGFEGAKGYYPHLFNTPENAGRVTSLPAKQYYMPESMSVKGRKAFDEWYNTQPEGYEFDNDKELIEYCIQDVTILRKACMKFASDFWELNKIDPFLDACTIAGACNKVFRSNYLKPDTIGIVPTKGYRYRDNQSKIALKWLSLIEIRKGIELQHAGRTVEKYITGVGKVDGYHEASNTVYEFMGCFYHGCEKCYPIQYQAKEYKQPRIKKSYRPKWYKPQDVEEDPSYLDQRNVNNEDDERNQQMFIRRENTERKCKRIREAGYNLVVMKECVFRRQLRHDREASEVLKNLPILTNEPIDSRDAFYGGRTNASKLYFKSDGKTKMHYFDICSLYPYINKTAKCPIGHPEVYIGDICNMIPWQGMDGLIKATVSPPRGLYSPVLPARMHSKLMFFLCTVCAEKLNKCKCEHTTEERAITGTWVIDELKLALERGYEIVIVHEIWEYEVTQYDPITKEGGIFVGYINQFLKIKAEASGWPEGCNTDAEKDAYINDFYEREGILLDKNEVRKNPPLRELAKNQLNSFWGRFGIRPDQVRTIIVDCYDELIMKMLDPNLEMSAITPVNDDNLLLSYKEKESARRPNNTANVVIAAFTTAYARMELYKYIDMLGPERIYYFDTDSVFFISRPGDPMPEKGSFLGQMTDELEKFGAGTYIIEFVSGGPKNYAFKTFTPSTAETNIVVKVKGITLNYESSKIVNFDVIKQLVMQAAKEVVSEGEGEWESEDEEASECPKKKKKIDSVEVELNSIRRTNTAEVYSTKVKKTYRVKYTKRKMKKNFDTLPYGY